MWSKYSLITEPHIEATGLGRHPCMPPPDSDVQLSPRLLDYHKDRRLNVCLDQQTRNGRMALFEACVGDKTDIATQILDAGANLSIINVPPFKRPVIMRTTKLLRS